MHLFFDPKRGGLFDDQTIGGGGRRPRWPGNYGTKDPLERAGVEFIDENGGGPGVRLRKRQRSKK